jgi:dTDP-4-amino-4,6-dideoxygalactose transaminase
LAKPLRDKNGKTEPGGPADRAALMTEEDGLTARTGYHAIPILDLRRQYDAIRGEILESIERVCASQQFVLGPEVEALECEIAQYVGTKHGVACASGTDALWLSLAAGRIGPGDKVITTPFSFLASASSIVRAGAEPVFVDVDPETLNLSPEEVRQLLRDANGSRIKAVLPVHLYGQCADMTALQSIAEEHELLLIEDAAQAIGAKWQGQRAGSMGAAAAFSFYPTKNLSAYGEAGIVTTNDSAMADRMRRLRNHGSPQRYLHTEFGWNARMDAIQAAVLRVKLKHIDDWNRMRRERADTYDRLLVKAGLWEASGSAQSNAAREMQASGRFRVRRLHASAEAFHVFHQHVIRVERRDELRKFLAQQGIGTEVYYPIPLHLQPVFAYLGYKKGDLPESERAAEDVLALPMFPELREEEQDRVVTGIAEFYS